MSFKLLAEGSRQRFNVYVHAPLHSIVFKRILNVHAKHTSATFVPLLSLLLVCALFSFNPLWPLPHDLQRSTSIKEGSTTKGLARSDDNKFVI